MLDALHGAKLSTRVGMLESMTVVEDYRRSFADASGVRRLEDDEVDVVRPAFDAYLDTMPDTHRGTVMFDVLDVVGRSDFGVGSAGLPAYSILIEGFSQALDNDVVLSMKQGTSPRPAESCATSAPPRTSSTTGTGPPSRSAPCRRTPTSSSAGPPCRGRRVRSGTSSARSRRTRPSRLGRGLRARRPRRPRDAAGPGDGEDPLRGRLRVRSGTGLGQRGGCGGTRIGGDADGFVASLSEFAHDYARQAREDHRLFVDAFRGGRFAHVAPA